MCGIAGGYSGKLDINILTQSIEPIINRGPDASSVYLSNNFGLAHCRLSIVDLLEQSNQPMISASGRTIIVFNGEIYNFKEIASKYHLKLRTGSDTEVLLEAFELKGESILNELNGMFAAAFYDSVEDSLTLIRDRSGKKPLYFTCSGNEFFFASELKSLLSFPVNVSINTAVISHFLHLGFIPGTETIYQNVFKLSKGGILKFKSGKAEIKQWYEIEKKIKPLNNISEEDALIQLETLLTSAVKYRLISDVPYGSFLSGGIDSSLITAIAAKNSGDQLKTFTIGFAESAYDESKYSRKISDYLDTKHEEFILTEKDAFEYLEEVMEYFDEPFADSSALPTYLICKMSKKNATMAISGEGGDELFMGYGAYQWADRISNPLIALSGKAITPFVNLLGSDRLRRAWTMFNGDKPVESLIFSQEQYLFSQSELDILLKVDFLSDRFNVKFKPTERELTAKERQELFDLKYYLTDDLLVKMDRASMMNAVEVRCPFLDYRLLEFAMNIPQHLKIKNGQSKYLLRKLLYKHFPEEMFQRPKKGFSIPLAKWLKYDLVYLIHENLSKSALEKTGVFNVEEVEKIKTRFFSGTDYLFNRIWVMIILQKWLLKHKYGK